MLPTRNGNLSVCSTAERGSATFPSHPPLSQLQPPPTPYVYPRDFPGNDRYGDNYVLVSMAFPGSLDYVKLFPSQPALSLCQPSTQAFTNNHEQGFVLASYVTVTTTLWLGPGTNEIAHTERTELSIDGPKTDPIQPPPVGITATPAIPHIEIPATGIDGPTTINTASRTLSPAQNQQNNGNGQGSTNGGSGSNGNGNGNGNGNNGNSGNGGVGALPPANSNPGAGSSNPNGGAQPGGSQSGGIQSGTVQPGNDPLGVLQAVGEQSGGTQPRPSQVGNTQSGTQPGTGGNNADVAPLRPAAQPGGSSTTQSSDSSRVQEQAPPDSGNSGSGGNSAQVSAPATGQTADNRLPVLPPVVIGSSTFLATAIARTSGSSSSSANAFIVGSQTLTQGGSITVGSGPSATTVAFTSNPSGQPVVVINDQSSTLSVTASATSAPRIIVGTQTITANTDGRFVVGSATLSVGGSVTIGTGSSTTLVALTTNTAGQTVVLAGSSTSTIMQATNTAGASASRTGVSGTVTAGSTGSGSSTPRPSAASEAGNGAYVSYKLILSIGALLLVTW